MGFFNKLFGDEQMKTLADIKRRAKVGTKITMLSVHLHGCDMSMADDLIGVPRTIRRVYSNCVEFDQNGPGGEERSRLFWPEEPKSGFLGLIATPNGKLAGFVDADTFIFENTVVYTLYRFEK